MLLVAFVLLLGQSGLVMAARCDQNATPRIIYGDGSIDNGFWTTTQGTTDDGNIIEIGLRAKQLYPVEDNSFYSRGDGTYVFPAGVGVDDAKGKTAVWQIELTANSDVGCDTDCHYLDEYFWNYLQDLNPAAKSVLVLGDPGKSLFFRARIFLAS